MVYFYLVMAALAASDAAAIWQPGKKKDAAVYLLLTVASGIGAFAYYTAENAPSLTRLLFSFVPHVSL